MKHSTNIQFKKYSRVLYKIDALNILDSNLKHLVFCFSIKERPGPSSRSITTSTWWRQLLGRPLHRTWLSIWLQWAVPLDRLATPPGPLPHLRLQCPLDPRWLGGPCLRVSVIMSTTPMHSTKLLQTPLSMMQALKAKMGILSTAAALWAQALYRIPASSADLSW